MDFERKAAEKQGHPSPVHDCIEDTHRCYDSCAHLLLTNIDRAAVFLGKTFFFSWIPRVASRFTTANWIAGHGAGECGFTGLVVLD